MSSIDQTLRADKKTPTFAGKGIGKWSERREERDGRTDGRADDGGTMNIAASAAWTYADARTEGGTDPSPFLRMTHRETVEVFKTFVQQNRAPRPHRPKASHAAARARAVRARPQRHETFTHPVIRCSPMGTHSARTQFSLSPPPSRPTRPPSALHFIFLRIMFLMRSID